MNLYPVFLEAGGASKWDEIVAFVNSQIPSAGEPLSMSEKLSLAGEMILRGMATVFIVLALLWAIIAIFGAVSKSLGKKEKTAEPVPAPAEPAAEQADDGEIIAAITAAIEAYRASEGLAGHGYRVVSFKKRSVKNRIGSDD